MAQRGRVAGASNAWLTTTAFAIKPSLLGVRLTHLALAAALRTLGVRSQHVCLQCSAKLMRLTTGAAGALGFRLALNVLSVRALV